MSLTNPKDVVTEERLAEFYQGIFPYLGGMPEMVANKFSRSDIYSTTEKMVGQWIDGKPIYQKTINVGALPNSATVLINHNISNIDKVIGLNAVGISSTGGCLPLPYTYASGSQGGTVADNIKIGVSTTEISIATGKDRSSITGYVTLHYTKTTDSAISIGVDTDYSTTEKIVGSWFGKPLYQKTIDCGALPNNTSKLVAHGISGTIHVKSITGFADKGDSSTRFIYIPYHESNYNAIVDIPNADTTNVRIITTGDLSTFTRSFATLQYTKTS